MASLRKDERFGKRDSSEDYELFFHRFHATFDLGASAIELELLNLLDLILSVIRTVAMIGFLFHFFGSCSFRACAYFRPFFLRLMTICWGVWIILSYQTLPLQR